MRIMLPSLFTNDLDKSLKVVYTGDATKPTPYFNAAAIEEMLGAKNAFSAANSRVNTIGARIAAYLAVKPNTPHLEPNTPIELIGSNKPAFIITDDGTYTILGVNSSKKTTARTAYYYNEAALFYVLNTARTDVANEIQHWINGEVLPAIAKTGEYIGVRKDSIGFRKHLTDAIKRRIDCQEFDESAYPTITDAIYLIRYGMNAAQLRDRLGLGDSDNIREHLSEDELNAIALIENDLTGALNLGLSLSDVLANKAFVMLHRQPL